MSGNCEALTTVKRELGAALFRRKYISPGDITRTKLARCLSLLDLTAIGVGSTLGAGIYVVAGTVARNSAGPAVVLSFLVAGVASVMAGLCYAEFGARVPRTGSAYVYSYVAVGEFTAFVIGWNMLLEYVIGSASVARALADYIDSLTNKAISTFFSANLTIQIGPNFHLTFNPLAFVLVCLLTAVLCLGVRESTVFNNIFTAINLYVVAYVTICGMFKYNLSYWKVPVSELPVLPNGTDCSTIEGKHAENCYGEGGFLPYGFGGMMSGAATCFYAFVGFDVIATAGEEVQNPQRNIPMAIVLCLAACALAYFAVSGTITLICPYYLLDAQTPLTTAFMYVGWPVATYVISSGAICALSASLLAGLLPLPRVIFAMAEDGLVFRWLSKVHPRTQTPLIATVLSGLLTAAMSALLDLDELVEMMSIGTLLAYAIVALSVMLLRYRPPLFPALVQSVNDADGRVRGETGELLVGQSGENVQLTRAVNSASADNTAANYATIGTSTSQSQSQSHAGSLADLSLWHSFLFTSSNLHPTNSSARFTSCLCVLFSVLSVVLCAFLAYLGLQSVLGIVLNSLLALLCLLIMLAISRMPQSDERVYFKVPLVPFLPCISVAINFYLMSKLSVETWIRFAVWMVFGLAIYFGYGVMHSSEREAATEENNRKSEQ